MHPAATQLLLVAMAGLLGSIPFGLILTRLAGLGDIRTIGSGSIGATNVLRTGRKDIAAATVLLDAGKGTAAALLWTHYGTPLLGAEAGLFAVLGHCFSVWLRFKGGKGVATGLGVLLAVAWPVALACMAIWLAAAALTRRSSAAGLLATAAAPALMLLAGPSDIAAIVLLMAATIVWQHRKNIARLRAGTEPKIGQKA